MLTPTANGVVRELLTRDYAAVAQKYREVTGQPAPSREEKEKLVSSICSAEFKRVESPSLRLEKFVHLGENSKKAEVERVVELCNQFSEPAKGEILHSQGGGRSLRMQLPWRLIVNQAGGILQNAGICLHRHFGFPTIPGSAVKGAARHAAWVEWDQEEDRERQAELALKTALVFGFPTGSDRLDKAALSAFPQHFSGRHAEQAQAWAGAVAFLRATPRPGMELTVDIVNCHHPAYYQNPDENAATDDENPNPQFFPAVKEGTVFTFTVLPVKRRAEMVQEMHGFDPVEFAVEMLELALTVHGIGAKTAAGYGWFTEDPHEAERRRVEELERRRQEEIAAKEHEEAAKRKALEDRAAQVADQNQRERQEQQRQHEAALEEAARVGLSPVANESDFGRVIAHVRLVVEAKGALEDEDVALLHEIVRRAVASAGKKQRRKWRHAKKGYWEHIRQWIGGEAANDWFSELVETEGGK